MADLSEYERISAASDDFRAIITSTIRDLCHAYMALTDRKDYAGCVTNLLAARSVLYEKQGEPVPRLRSKVTGIGNESLQRTLFSLATTVERISELFNAVEEEGIPDNISEWLATKGKQFLKGLAYLISDLLAEQNLCKIAQKLNPLG